MFKSPNLSTRQTSWLYTKQLANDLNLGRQRANLASSRVEGGNPGSLDYSTSALNNLATLPPTIGNSWIWSGGGCRKPKSLRKWMKLNNTAFTGGGVSGGIPFHRGV